MKKIALSLFAIAALFTSCSNDDDSTLREPQVEAPATYQFMRNGNSTVSYSGQTTRIQMGEALANALKNNSSTEAELDGMFANTGNYFSTSELNASSKNIRSKTAASNDYFSANTTESNEIRVQFESYLEGQVNEVFPKWQDIATPGNAGQLQENGGAIRYVNSRGLEYDQAFIKGLIGALMVDQMLNNYLSTSVLDAGTNRADNDAEILADGKDYTVMEHKWDEAFGYLYGTDDALAPQLGADSFLNKYVARVENDEDFTGIAQDIYNAFKLGRAAITDKNYEVRDAQAEIIREKISEIIGIRAVYYLQSAKSVLGTDNGSAFHDLSEGYGFIMSLQFTRQPGTEAPYFTKSEIDAYLAQLTQGNGFWDLTSATLDTMSAEIAARFNFTIEQAAPNN